jgi:putative endonuclease
LLLERLFVLRQAETANEHRAVRGRRYLSQDSPRRVVSDHYVYVLECSDGSFYTGYTTDPDRRIDEHNAGEGAKYTRGRTPVELRYVESWASRSDALAREYEIKSLTRAQKETLVSEANDDQGHREG